MFKNMEDKRINEYNTIKAWKTMIEVQIKNNDIEGLKENLEILKNHISLNNAHTSCWLLVHALFLGSIYDIGKINFNNVPSSGEIFFLAIYAVFALATLNAISNEAIETREYEILYQKTLEHSIKM